MLYPQEKDPQYSLDRRLDELVWTQRLEEKSIAPAGD
jgi:hypothetical protein